MKSTSQGHMRHVTLASHDMCWDHGASDNFQLNITLHISSNYNANHSYYGGSNNAQKKGYQILWGHTILETCQVSFWSYVTKLHEWMR